MKSFNFCIVGDRQQKDQKFIHQGYEAASVADAIIHAEGGVARRKISDDIPPKAINYLMNYKIFLMKT